MNTNTGKIKGIAGRAGHWSATHRKLAIWGWIAFVVLAFYSGGQIGLECDGAYAEYVKLPAQNFLKLPDGLDHKNHPAEIGGLSFSQRKRKNSIQLMVGSQCAPPGDRSRAGIRVPYGEPCLGP